ncbi:MAG: adenylate/guanylate cyclase domain-containing protein [Gammaproteobacteria bacterium]|nr:adenylate/guanylate cyclase domain-containing protein [Gammaproteobacteria bacterium]
MAATVSYKISGKTHKLNCKAVLTIGRDKHSDIVIPELTVSRNHAMIRCLGEGDFYLIDSGSSNGSFVNKQRIVAPKLLKNSDILTIGSTDILFEELSKDVDLIDSVSMLETIVHDAPVIKQITIMVADIRGFTSMSEQVPINTLTKIMNSWFHEVNNIVIANGGLVDKFIGDCVFARWESEDDQLKTIAEAIAAACDINKVTENLNKEYKSHLPSQLKIGVGVNTGTASMGGLGQDNTALGDAVNIAFRMESASKALNKDIVLSEFSFKFLPEKLWKGKQQHIKVKGKKDPVSILALTFPEAKKMLKKIS